MWSPLDLSQSHLAKFDFAPKRIERQWQIQTKNPYRIEYPLTQLSHITLPQGDHRGLPVGSLVSSERGKTHRVPWPPPRAARRGNGAGEEVGESPGPGLLRVPPVPGPTSVQPQRGGRWKGSAVGHAHCGNQLRTLSGCRPSTLQIRHLIRGRSGSTSKTQLLSHMVVFSSLIEGL